MLFDLFHLKHHTRLEVKFLETQTAQWIFTWDRDISRKAPDPDSMQASWQ